MLLLMDKKPDIVLEWTESSNSSRESSDQFGIFFRKGREVTSLVFFILGIFSKGSSDHFSIFSGKPV